MYVWTADKELIIVDSVRIFAENGIQNLWKYIMVIIVTMMMIMMKYWNERKKEILWPRETQFESPLRISYHPTAHTFPPFEKHMKGKTIYYNRYPANYYWIISENLLSWECHIILISDCLPFITDVFQTWQIGWEKTCFFHSRYVKALPSFFQSFETFTIRGPDFLEFISLCPFFLF